MLSKLFNSKLTLQTVLAVLIASLATAAIVSATTIGNNISTDGTLTVTGNTGIGTTSPSQKLSVTGKLYTTGGIQFPDGSLQTAAASAAASSLSGQIAFYNTDGSTVSGTSTLFIAPTGYVGIGTTSPNWKLSIAGQGSFDDLVRASYFTATSTTATSTFFGAVNMQSYTIGIGTSTSYYTQGINIPNQALIGTSTAGDETGFNLGRLNYNLYIGDGGKLTTTTTATLNPADDLSFENLGKVNGLYNTFIGMGAGVTNVSGNFNTFVGSLTGQNNINGDQNTFLGTVAGQANTSGFHDTYLGVGAGQSNSVGNHNTFVGTDNNLRGLAGSYNTSIGSAAGLWNSGEYNVSFGYQALSGPDNSNTGNNQVAVGAKSLQNNTTGRQNTAVGMDALYNNSTGIGNVALGYLAGLDLKDGSTNIFIGQNATVSQEASTTLTNSIGIGLNVTLDSSNEVILGNSSITKTLLNGNIGIGTTTPFDILQLASLHPYFYITDTNSVANKKHWFLENNNGLFSIGTTSDSLSVTASFRPFAITDAGDVGMGVTSPASALHINKANGAGDVAIIIQNNAVTDGETASLLFRTSTGVLDGGKIVSERLSIGNSKFHFYTNYGGTITDRMVIDNFGLVGIGTTTPASLLHVSAGTNATTTVEFGAQAVTSKTCFNVRDALGAATSFYFVGTAMVVEPNRCRYRHHIPRLD